MPGGGIFLIETANVDLERTDVEAGPYVQLRVCDTGTGMTQDVMSYIFEPFFTTKEPGKGTGLGLATVYGIVRRNGGSIRVSSTPGEGTVFTIYLPLVNAGVRTQSASEPGPGFLGGIETILVVEDQEQVREMTVRVMEDYGYRALEAANPGEALLLAERYDGPIDLLLTDWSCRGLLDLNWPIASRP
jgi:two-component system cell cycle sensor histidine kinase/response regulator CckA